MDRNKKETEVYLRLDLARLPQHIAIIMDGNGRWARRRHMPRVAGHRAGVASVRSTVETAARIGIPALTLYAFSEENWKKRPKTEVDFLMRLLCRFLKAEINTLNENNIRLQYIGRQRELPESVQREMEEASNATSKNTGMLLTLALNYSARSEIVDAFRSLAEAAARNGGLEHIAVDEQAISDHLYTRGLPDPDLVIRTSGEMRLSNFLLWQLAYAEIYVTQTLWPDFRGVQLLEGIEEYQKRERRYGGLGHDHSHPPKHQLPRPAEAKR
jgi:undecaprenyl diphosphate synthase